MSATEKLRAMLDERGAEHYDGTENTLWGYEDYNEFTGIYRFSADETRDGYMQVRLWHATPEQAIAATLGREPCVNPTWERWHKSLRHDEIKSIGDAVEQLMYEAIEFGGDMGPNGNTYNGIDEGDVLTAGFINEWVARFESMLDGSDATGERHGGAGTCHDMYTDDDEWFACSECNAELRVHEPFGVIGSIHYCPNCGREVVDE